MSNTGDPSGSALLARSVEKDKLASPTKGRSNGMARGNNGLEDVCSTMAAESEPNTNLEPSSSKINSSTVMPSQKNVLKPLSRSCSPAEVNYENFRSTINDSRGYYAKALRRHKVDSASPPTDRRVAPRLAPSLQYLPRNLEANVDAATSHVSSGPYVSREHDDIEIIDHTPRRFPLPRFPAHENLYAASASDSPEPAGPRRRPFQRKVSEATNKDSHQPDPYVGVDNDTDQYDEDYEDEDGEYSYSAHHKYLSQRQLMAPSPRREPQGLQLRRSAQLCEDSETSFGQRYQSQAPQSIRPVERDDQDFNQGHKSPKNSFPVPGSDITDDEEQPLFVPAESRQLIPFKQQPGATGGGRPGRPQKRFTHDTFITDGPERSSGPARPSGPARSLGPARSSGPASKKRKATDQGSRFNQPGAALAPSRYSGDPALNWGVNQDPSSVPQDSVSDAALLKRGLTRGAKEKVCKRGYGANDPENVNIVNMKEDGMSFAEIVEQLNEDRVSNGRAPSLSVCGVTSRYNRTAPLLFAAEGRQFIPLSKRSKGDVLADGPLIEKPVWNDDRDLILAQCVKDIDKEKWGRVAKEYSRRTGNNITAAAAALRHTLL